MRRAAVEDFVNNEFRPDRHAVLAFRDDLRCHRRRHDRRQRAAQASRFDLIEEARQQSHGLGIFIRSLVGLDRGAATDALSEFVKGTSANANQIEFIDLMVQYLTENGIMEVDRLYESPFTDINPQGPEGVFPSATVGQLVKVLAEVKLRAA